MQGMYDLCKDATSTANIQEGKVLERLSLYWVDPMDISHVMHTKAAGDKTNSTWHSAEGWSPYLKERHRTSRKNLHRTGFIACRGLKAP